MSTWANIHMHLYPLYQNMFGWEVLHVCWYLNRTGMFNKMCHLISFFFFIIVNMRCASVNYLFWKFWGESVQAFKLVKHNVPFWQQSETPAWILQKRTQECFCICSRSVLGQKSWKNPTASDCGGVASLNCVSYVSLLVHAQVNGSFDLFKMLGFKKPSPLTRGSSWRHIWSHSEIATRDSLWPVLRKMADPSMCTAGPGRGAHFLRHVNPCARANA